MKKILCVIMAAACLALTACDSTDSPVSGNNSVSTESTQSTAETKKAADKTAALLEAMEFPEMIEQDPELLGINAGDLEDHSLYVCGSAAMPDEFGIFVAKSAEAAAGIKTKVEARIAFQTETYTTYTPDEVYKLEGSICEIDGNTVYYAICADGAKAKEILG